MFACPRTTFGLAVLLLGAAVSVSAQSAPSGMVVIPKGMYQPAFRAAAEPKEVPVRSFGLDILPVTNGDFLEFVRANPRWQRSQAKRIFADQSYLRHWKGDLELGTNAPSNVPVTFVSWFAAKAYAQWKGKRLPTVAEWEFAALASATRPDGEKDTSFKRQLLEWYSSPATQLSPVDAARKNYWGVADLHGLIWEWVADFNTAMVTGDSRSGSGLENRYFCGAGAQNAVDPGDYAAFLRFGFRSSLQADYTVHNLGFRCAKDL